ncbi:NapC/NirT family cytochrome c [Magnetospirillum sp. UT-4]|uniref:NapC/NirT family cytochrome c n=1 Tax=Magnetospirillum sp. UT-4 TaxID=2681467 RepID=UPI00138000B0|nr:NapC/NirT family cytochrome c [Magnetospirillum sp. UT-4]CAA7613629.1 putative tetraheme cytochrome-c type [Magnetospirillum sp. UT-4]
MSAMKGDHGAEGAASGRHLKRSAHRAFWRKAVFVMVGVVVGVFTMAGFVTAIEWTNRTEFCISCHSMKQNYAEYKESIHYLNRSGAHAQCSDCHVPKALGPKLVRKFLAYKDIVAEIQGTIDTPEKLEAKRPELAERVWAYMAATDSRECRNCHSFDSMNTSKQTIAARNKHPEAALENKTCISCHKGVAHKLPSSKDDL